MRDVMPRIDRGAPPAMRFSMQEILTQLAGHRDVAPMSGNQLLIAGIVAKGEPMSHDLGTFDADLLRKHKVR